MTDDVIEQVKVAGERKLITFGRRPTGKRKKRRRRIKGHMCS